MKATTRSSSLLSRVLFIALVGALTWVWVLNRQLHAQAANAARVTAELNIERKRAVDAEKRLAEERARAVETLVTPEPKKEEATPPQPRPRGFPGGMTDNPAMQTMLASGIKNALDQRYGALFRKLKLDPARLGRLKELLTERQMSSIDIVRAAQREGLGNDEISALLATSSAETDANVRTMLGESDYAQFQDYERNIDAYGLLDNVERRLSFTATPLSEKQSAEVLRIIAETSESATPPGMANNPMFRVMQGTGVGPSMMGSLNQARITDKTIEAATPVLAESQVEVLRQIQAEQQTQRDAMSSMGGPFRP